VAREFSDEPGSLTGSGPSAIIANGEVFADALVAGPVAAKAQVPILLTPRSELHSEVEEFLRDAGIAHVVLMGGTDALSAEVEAAVGDLGITDIDRIAGTSRFETATQFAQYASTKFSEDCFAGDHVGLARGDVPFDSFSAAPLLAQRCAPLVLTSSKALPDATTRYLDDVRGTASPDAVGVSVLGGNAVVSRAALDGYLGIEGVLGRAAAQRAEIVADLTAKIRAGIYGVDADNVLRGPAGFRIYLGDCPDAWSDSAGVTDTEIRVGYSLVQSGNLAAYDDIAHGMENYFEWVNENDPVADRRIVLITKDDGFVPHVTVSNVDAFIEAENVLSITTLGSPQTLAAYDRINDECIPHPFAQSSHPAWGDPEVRPWTTGALMAYSTEAILWGTWIEQNLADKLPVRVAAVVTDYDVGIAYEQAFAEWAEAHPEVVSSFTPVRHRRATARLTAQMQTVASADPDVYISMTLGHPCLLAVITAESSGLTASIRAKGGAMFQPSNCRGINAQMRPAGSAAHDWLSFDGGAKVTTDPRYAGEPFIEFLKQNLEDADLDPNAARHGTGYRFGFPYVEALRIAADLPGGITRTNFILAVRSLDIDHPLLLDGIRFTLDGNDDPYAIEGSAVYRYDAHAESWGAPIEIIEVPGQTPNCVWIIPGPQDAAPGCRTAQPPSSEAN